MDIQALLEEYIEDNGAVAAAIGFIDKGNVQFFTYGNRSIKNSEPITKDTIFEIGSITKVFTTLALMDMASKGLVDIDAPIENYLPGVKIPEFEGKKILLRHLATHTSGLPRIPDNLSIKNPNNPYEDYTVENLYDFLNQYKLTRAPGELFEYSNTGLGLLGHILSLKSKINYEELICNLISEPFKMKNTKITLNSNMKDNLAYGHHLKEEVSYWDIPTLGGAGALRSNISDMTNFLAANLGLLDSPLTTLLKQCHQKQFEVMSTFGIGFGWMITTSNDSEIIWHNGGTGGFRNYLGFNLKTGKGVVILSNSSEDWPDELGAVLLDPNFNRPVIDKKLANDPIYLNKFSGSYEATLSHDNSKQELQIFVYGKLLASSLSGGECGMLYPVSHGVFRVKGFPDGKVRFIFDKQGAIIKVVATGTGGAVYWEGVPK